MQKNLRKTLYFLIPLIFLGLYIFSGTVSFKREPYSDSQYVLDTFTTIKIYDHKRSTPDDVRNAFQILKKAEKLINFYDQESKLTLLNNEIAQQGKVAPSPEMLKIIEASLNICRLTSGNFDPCLGNLVSIWAFDKGGRLPSEKEIEMALSMSGARYVEIEGGIVKAKKPVKFDLGGIGKGWAVDLAAEFLKSKGYRKFLINTVSSTLVCNKKDDENLKIGVENPRGKGIVAVIYAKDGETVSTSADNQKFFFEKGKRYHHILDPKTGYPATNFISVTVVAEKPAYWTDAISTAVFVMDKEEAVKFSKKNQVKLFAITVDGKKIIYPEGSWIRILSE